MDDFDALEALPRPPRPVPFSLAARLRFGGSFGLIGWLFLAMGLAFAIGFGEFMHVGVHLALTLGDTATIDGTVLGWSDTGASINEQPVIATLFEYTVDGVAYEGASFAVDEARQAGTMVQVVYSTADPAASKIEGMLISEMPPWLMLFLGIFPIIGLWLALKQLRRGNREVRVLRDGRGAWGRATGHEPTGVTVNGDPEIAVTFEFTDHLGRRHTVTQKTMEPDDLLDDDEEALLYLPERPEAAVLLDSLPGIIVIERDGRYRAPGARAAFKALLPPALTAAVIAISAITLG